MAVAPGLLAAKEWFVDVGGVMDAGMLYVFDGLSGSLLQRIPPSNPLNEGHFPDAVSPILGDDGDSSVGIVIGHAALQEAYIYRSLPPIEPSTVEGWNRYE